MKEEAKEKTIPPYQIDNLLPQKREELLVELYDFELFRKKMIRQIRYSTNGLFIFGATSLISLAAFFLIFKQLLAPLQQPIILWISLGVGILGVLLSLAVLMLSFSDLRNRSKREFFPKLLKTLYPTLEYNPYQQIELNDFKSWPFLEHYEDLQIESGQDHFEGTYAGFEIEMAEMVLIGAKKGPVLPFAQDRTEVIFNGILLLIKNLPKEIDKDTLTQNPKLFQALEQTSSYWGIRPQLSLLNNGYLLVIIRTNRSFLELTLQHKAAVYKEEILQEYYNDLQHCLHFVKELAKEIQ